MKEEWRPIRGLDDYEISSQGRVRSSRYKSQERILTPKCGENGLRYQLYSETYRVRLFYAHLLVLRAFVGPKPEGYKVLFKDNNKCNPALSNLSYVPSDSLRKREYSRQRKERFVSRDKILMEINAGKTQSQLAREYGISPSLICKVVSGERRGVYMKS